MESIKTEADQKHWKVKCRKWRHNNWEREIRGQAKGGQLVVVRREKRERGGWVGVIKK